MKYFLLYVFALMFIASSFIAIDAQEFHTEIKEIDKDMYYKERAKSLTSLYENPLSVCKSPQFPADQIAFCSERVKEQILNKLVEVIHLMTSKKVEDAEAKLISEKNDEKCISYNRTLLESLNVAYKTEDNCATLKLLVPVK